MRLTMCFLGSVMCAGAASAGPLDPPMGPISPTNKTLQQVEPRTPISAPITITQPGSYYLTGNASATFIAISVIATDVTIDLNGFSLAGNNSGTGVGVSIGNVDPGAVTIRNGTIRDFGSRGVSSPFINARVILEDLHITRCDDEGVFVEGDSKIIDCTADFNGASGFRVDSAANIDGCISNRNGSHGFWIESGLIANSLARDNDLNGFNLGSIITNANSVVAVDCVSHGNTQEGFFSTDPVTLVNCHAVENSDLGFQLDNDASLEGCVARQNGDVGFLTGQSATLSRCIASENAANGINTSANSTIESCSAYLNDGFGIATSLNCAITNSASRDNTSHGFFVGAGSSVHNCAANINDGDGFQLQSDARLTHCTADGNVGAGIRGTSDTVIDSCNVTDNSTGIIAGAGGLVVRCFAAGNSANYDMTAADHGAIISPVGVFTTTNAFANISY